MTNLEALETLVGSTILQVKLIGGEESPWKAEITTTNGEIMVIIATMDNDLEIVVKTG